METPARKANKIVILTGPESTAKSTIAFALMNKLGGVYVEEHARNYIAGLKRKYTSKDVLEIANWQRREMEKCRQSVEPKIWFVDTYLIITKVWLKWLFKTYPEWIDDEIAGTKDCLYLLCSPDIVWTPDIVRENGGANRLKLFDEYKAELEKYKLNFKIVTGSGDDRVENALTFVKEYIAEE